MKINHQPATPLPFKVDRDTFLCSGGENFISPAYYTDAEDGEMTREQAIGNIKYLAHAANAYPQLVAALKDSTRELGADDFQLTAGQKKRLNANRILLRDLGEQ